MRKVPSISGYGRRILARKSPVQNIRQLEAALHWEWQQLSQQDIRRLTGGTRHRVEAVIQARGGGFISFRPHLKLNTFELKFQNVFYRFVLKIQTLELFVCNQEINVLVIFYCTLNSATPKLILLFDIAN